MYSGAINLLVLTLALCCYNEGSQYLISHHNCAYLRLRVLDLRISADLVASMNEFSLIKSEIDIVGIARQHDLVL